MKNNITIKEIEDNIKNILKESLILNFSSTYEKIDNSEDLKLVIFLNKIFQEDISLLYTKFIFYVDKNKIFLTKNSFLYLYDINCIYNTVNFNDIQDFNIKFKNIFQKDKFGDNIKILSKFIESPAFLINNWLKDNNITNVSVFDIIYNPKIHIIPCKSLFFSFNINLNNTVTIELTITKEENKLFIYSFKLYDKIVNIEKNDLNSLIQTIGDFIKNNVK
jgi:hypothetical protein